MADPNERLREARRRAGYNEAKQAAHAFGWNEITYTSHENGTRGLRPSVAARYAKAFKVTPEHLLYARPTPGREPRREDPKTVRLVGWVSAGEAYFFSDQGDIDQVSYLDTPNEDTVAVEIRGDSLGPFFDRWLVFYDDVRRPVTDELIGRLCVVGLDTGQILIKKIRRSKSRGRFHLYSQIGDPILDATIEWAARVKHMMPR